jgi:ABC-type Fe3+/spermidine/putrescine transport system ATPase subunit
VFPPNVYALRDVSVEIRDGKFLVVLGPSGSGKTSCRDTKSRRRLRR